MEIYAKLGVDLEGLDIDEDIREEVDFYNESIIKCVCNFYKTKKLNINDIYETLPPTVQRRYPTPKMAVFGYYLENVCVESESDYQLLSKYFV